MGIPISKYYSSIVLYGTSALNIGGSKIRLGFPSWYEGCCSKKTSLFLNLRVRRLCSFRAILCLALTSASRFVGKLQILHTTTRCWSVLLREATPLILAHICASTDLSQSAWLILIAYYRWPLATEDSMIYYSKLVQQESIRSQKVLFGCKYKITSSKFTGRDMIWNHVV
jgi:hypothetical protein